MNPAAVGSVQVDMRISHRLRALVALLFVLLLVAAACGDDDDTDTAAGSDTTTATTEPTGTTAAEGGGESGITIAGFQFQVPDSVAAGSTVEVANTDSAPHTVTADDGAFDSGQVDADSGGSFTAPSEAGTYAFHCEVHPNMKGELVVA